MALSCREQIVAAVLARLKTITAANVERNRRTPIAEDDLKQKSSIVLFEGDNESVGAMYTNEDGYELPLNVQGAVQGSGDAAASAANALRAAVIKAIRADVTLGRIARNLVIVDTGNWEGVAVTAPQYEGFSLEARVTYATKEFDPFNFA